MLPITYWYFYLATRSAKDLQDGSSNAGLASLCLKDASHFT